MLSYRSLRGEGRVRQSRCSGRPGQAIIVGPSSSARMYGMPTLQTARNQVRAAIAAGEHRRALALVQGIRRSFPDDYETMGLLGQIHLECERRAEARELFQALLGVDPENLLARSSLAIIAEEEGDLRGALEQFTRIFELDLSNRQIAAEIRRLNARTSGPKPADPGYSKHALARRLLREGMHEEAVLLFESALESAPEPVLVALGMAQALWLTGRLEEAGDVAGEVLGSHPACLKALVVRAGALHAKGNPEATLLLEKAARVNPGNAVARELFEKAGLILPPVGLEADLPEDSLLEGSEEPEEMPAEGQEDESEEGEDFELPEAEAEGEWVRERAMAEPWRPSGQEPQLHLAAARAHQARQLFEPAVAEYRTALRLDSSLAREVREAALAMAEVVPEDASVRWLVADALVLEGRLRQAMENYLMALKGSNLEADREQDGTNSGDR